MNSIQTKLRYIVSLVTMISCAAQTNDGMALRNNSITNKNSSNIYSTDKYFNYSENVTLENSRTAGDPLWKLIMDKSQLTLTIIGTLANITTVITLSKHGESFPPIIRMLLKHQGVVDGLACSFAALLLVGKPNGVLGIYGLDTFICMLWHGQFIYWCAVFISIYNLVIVACERYLAICHPFKHASFTKGKIYILMLFVYILCPICTGGAAFQNRMTENGTCVSEHYMQGDIIEFLYAVFSVSTLFSYWGIPFFFFVFFYGMVAFKLNRRKRNTDFGTTRAIDNASKQLTKTAIAVTCIFIVSLGYDIWYYLLGKFELVVYKKNTPLQKIGVWLSAFNSVANPFVYIMMMPSYRKCVIKTFLPCVVRDQPETGKGRNSTIETSMSVSLPSAT